MAGLSRAVRTGIVLLSVTFFTASCDTPFGATRIHDLLAAPAQYDGKTVKVSGEVTNVIKLPFVAARFFTVKDGSGEITILTYGELPAAQSSTTVRGVFSTVAIAGADAIGPHITVGNQNAK